VAILMLADAVESATRTLAEPTPSRIDALVRAIANARLMDGQFDDCDLTLRELHDDLDSISKTVAAIYHGRVEDEEADQAHDEDDGDGDDEPIGHNDLRVCTVPHTPGGWKGDACGR
jgi:hypothetical protein